MKKEKMIKTVKMTFKKFAGSECFAVYRGGRAFGILTLSDSNAMFWDLVVLSPQVYFGRYMMKGGYDDIISYMENRFNASIR